MEAKTHAIIGVTEYRFFIRVELNFGMLKISVRKKFK
jgi:hypothetical protein